MKKLIFIVGLIICLLPFTASYGAEEGKVLSPYFFVQSEDPTVDPFPLLETKAKVDIAGVIAAIELTQVYKNEGKRTIEAVYVFPLGTKSAIHAMRMKIGDRVIEAKIEERAAAKRIYQQAKQAGNPSERAAQHHSPSSDAVIMACHCPLMYAGQPPVCDEMDVFSARSVPAFTIPSVASLGTITQPSRLAIACSKRSVALNFWIGVS